jgi:hypothetical protein
MRLHREDKLMLIKEIEMISKFTSKILILSSVAFLMALGLIFGGTTTASADDGTTDPTPGPRKIIVTQQVELHYQNQLLVLQKIELGIAKVNEGFPKLTAKLAKLKEKGIDISDVEAKMAAFVSAVNANKQHYDQAKSLLNAHAGFDVNGKVTNLEQAHSTLEAVRVEFKAYRDGIRDASKAFRQAVKAMRELQRSSN